jgi:hypothetical protein
VPPETEPQKLAASKPEETPAPDIAKIAVAEDPVPSAPARAESEVPAAEAIASEVPVSPSESRVASTIQDASAAVISPTNETVPAETKASSVASLPTSATTSPDADAISMKIAALDSRSVVVQPKPRPAAAIARFELQKRLQARRMAERRRIAMQARQVQLFPQPPLAPLNQQFNQPPAVARTR